MTLNERTYQIIIGVLVLIILVGGWFAFGKKQSSTTGSPAVAKTDTMQDTSSSMSGSEDVMGSSGSGSSMAVSGDAVSVSDQPAGDKVAVNSVYLPQMGWVAVRDSSGHVLGAARLDAGTHSDVQVDLLRNTEAGEHYQVLLYIDDGDKVYDLHKDTLLTNSDGAVAGATFTASHGD